MIVKGGYKPGSDISRNIVAYSNVYWAKKVAGSLKGGALGGTPVAALTAEQVLFDDVRFLATFPCSADPPPSSTHGAVSHPSSRSPSSFPDQKSRGRIAHRQAQLSESPPGVSDPLRFAPSSDDARSRADASRDPVPLFPSPRPRGRAKEAVIAICPGGEETWERLASAHGQPNCPFVVLNNAYSTSYGLGNRKDFEEVCVVSPSCVVSSSCRPALIRR